MEKVKLSELPSKLESFYDVFITSASFEARSLSVTENIITSIKFGHRYVVGLLHNREFIQSSLDKFIKEYDFNIIDVDSLNQLITVDNFLSLINSVLFENPKSSFLIDISTFTRQNLLILIRLLRNNLSNSNNKVQCIYSIASDYAIGLAEEEKWLTKGVFKVSSVFGYIGSISPSKPYHLIILMGYEVERASSLIYAYEPSKITVGFASRNSSLSDKHYELNKDRFQKLIQEFPNAEEFEFSCSEVESIKVILEQAEKCHDYNVVISPMNNKLSTLFVAAASFENKNIQVAIAVPMLYNFDGYSSPGDDCIIINANEFLLKDN